MRWSIKTGLMKWTRSCPPSHDDVQRSPAAVSYGGKPSMDTSTNRTASSEPHNFRGFVGRPRPDRRGGQDHVCCQQQYLRGLVSGLRQEMGLLPPNPIISADLPSTPDECFLRTPSFGPADAIPTRVRTSSMSSITISACSRTRYCLAHRSSMSSTMTAARGLDIKDIKYAFARSGITITIHIKSNLLRTTSHVPPHILPQVRLHPCYSHLDTLPLSVEHSRQPTHFRFTSVHSSVLFLSPLPNVLNLPQLRSDLLREIE
jgi:hypothetical protein